MLKGDSVTHQSSMPATAVKRSRDTTPATRSLNMVKRPRPSNATRVGTFVRQAISSKQSTLSSTYEHLTRLPKSKAKNRPQLKVELPRTPSLEFIGLSPITSFLSNSSYSDFSLPSSTSSEAENTDQCDNQDELHGLGTVQGLNYDWHPHHEVPYSMLHDNVTRESELHSYELMRKLMQDGSPSFLDIPTSSPVHHALDLGCRDGHWITHAAHEWGAHGTKVTGLSMPPSVDEEQTTLPRVPVDKENVKLLRHDFLTQQLPFRNNSIDYVRLNDAVAVIPAERWDFVLSEIHRVLCPGGRLELIHDQLCFSSIGPETPVRCTFANAAKGKAGKVSMRSTSPPESKKSPYEDWEAEMRNCSDIERLYLDMLAQRYGIHPLPRTMLLDAIRRRFGDKGLINVSDAHVCLPSREFMTRTHASSSPKNSIKSSFKRREFGISITIDWGNEKPSKTIGSLPPPAPAPAPAPAVPPQQVPAAAIAGPAEYVSLTSLPPVLSKKAASLMGVVQLSPAGVPYHPPGLVVVYTASEATRRPMTYLPMSPTELDMHSNKHVHSVISAKLALEAHIDELHEKGKPSMSHEALDEALWQYAMFRRKRFNWPEMNPFEWESGFEGDGESEEQMRRCTLPETQTTDGLTPVRLFEIFEVIKAS